MTPMQIAILVLVFVATFGLAIWMLGRSAGSTTQQRLRQVLGESGATAAPGRSGAEWIEGLAKATRGVARLSLPSEGYETSALRRRFMTAGVRSAAAPSAYFGMKTVLALAFPVLIFALLTATGAALRGPAPLFLLLVASAIGYYLPNVLLSRAIEARQLEIFEAFPDALDLMTICMEAGLGTEAAITKVADELAAQAPTLSEELRLVNLELRAGAPRDRALRNLAMRTGVEEVEGFVAMIIQADRFGTSIAQSLRVHSETVRTRRRQKAEEMAAKVPLKLLFPLIFCIFPALLLVILGPAVLQMIRVVLPAMKVGG